MNEIKVIIVTAGTYDLLGRGTTATCAVGEVHEAYSPAVSSYISSGSMRVATGQEITDAMAAGKAF